MYILSSSIGCFNDQAAWRWAWHRLRGKAEQCTIDLAEGGPTSSEKVFASILITYQFSNDPQSYFVLFYFLAPHTAHSSS